MSALPTRAEVVVDLDTIAANGNDGSNGPNDGAPTQEVRIESLTVAA